ncbi:phosphoethanolamine--lipid A transferase [Bowmanella sp. Y26]|uniref:phosphoethanolamine transferase n=1 Tax=Bowmanella yangjiangensis TaxID=2811230 RepID=UPI001BDCAC0C|nr:phosphoethanolamine--lipid A transferase [Bowmanella yangjiangensis]MBT1063587.1 phosphoethanolamine--lipid A transferase [Bowmanella yangjiangensis]
MLGFVKLKPWQCQILLVLFLLLSANASFFTQLTTLYPVNQHWGFVLSVALLLGVVLLLMVQLFSLLLTPRWLYPIILLIAAITGYFTDELGIVFDRVMLTNVLQTNPGEAGDLLSTGLFWRIVLLTLVPSVLFWSLNRQGLKRPGIKASLATLSATFALTILSMLPFTDQYASFFREHKSVRYNAIPIFPIYSAIDLGARHLKGKVPDQLVELTGDTVNPKPTGHSELMIVVVGETARADHFSLNGYERQTNPLLAEQANLLSYANVSSCGTSTAVSVPCMFSFSDRDSFDLDSAKYTENVLDVLHKAKVNVLWRDNNSDSKGVATRLPYEDYHSAEVNPACGDTECRDVGMLAGLQKYIDQQQGDILIVLHQMGSHGPAYYKRYPAEFERFVPACKSKELSECSEQEIINAYDNSILYTDYFLNEVIELLKRNTPKYETAMLYMSDHGESLGENGLYLHGMPYFLAPKAQTHVPFLVWVGESSDILLEPSRRLTHEAFSHDDFSCSLLQSFEIDSHIAGDTPCVPYFVYRDE